MRSTSPQAQKAVSASDFDSHFDLVVDRVCTHTRATVSCVFDPCL